MIANGSLEAGAMLFQHLLSPGDRVVVEQPTYDRTLLILQQPGVELVPVGVESDGIDVSALEEALAAGPIKLAHIIPNAHNPAGCTLSAEKRSRLVELAAEHDFWIFEDDPYRELPFEGAPLETMLELDQAGRVVHASSFSKTVSPGVRVGYLAGPAEEIAKLAKHANENYISPNMLAESIVLELCARAPSTPTSSSSKARSRSAATRSSPPCASRSQRPSSSSPRAATSSGSTSPGASIPSRSWPRRKPTASPSSPVPTS